MGCTQWHDLNKNEFQLKFSIDFLFERIVPKMNHRSEDYFVTLYPVLWVLKNNQQTNRALNEFESFLESNFLSVLEKINKRQQISYKQIYTYTIILLRLATCPSKTKKIKDKFTGISD